MPWGPVPGVPSPVPRLPRSLVDDPPRLAHRPLDAAGVEDVDAGAGADPALDVVLHLAGDGLAVEVAGVGRGLDVDGELVEPAGPGQHALEVWRQPRDRQHDLLDLRGEDVDPAHD